MRESMLDVARIWEIEDQLYALTGLTKNEACELLEDVEAELKEMGHLRSLQGGRPAKLEIKGIFVMLMMYYRHYLTLEALGALFNLNDSNVKRWIDSSEAALRTALAKKNLSHLIAPNRARPSRPPLSSIGKSISMALNSR